MKKNSQAWQGDTPRSYLIETGTGAQLQRNRIHLRPNNAGLKITAGQRTMSKLIWELTGQPFVLPVMLTGHIWSFWKWNKVKFPCCSVVSVVASRCVLSFAELWSEILGEMQLKNCCFTIRALKTDSGVYRFAYWLLIKLFSMNKNFSSLVMRSTCNMNHWWSFMIKISHRDTYTRNHYRWRHLLCIYLFTNLICMIMIFNLLRVSLYSYKQCTY